MDAKRLMESYDGWMHTDGEIQYLEWMREEENFAAITWMILIRTRTCPKL
jgi:hypothetical protein